MRDAAVGFHCPDCVKAGNKDTRQTQALYGGHRSRDPKLTTYVILGLNVLVWLAITATGGRSSWLTDRLALMPTGRCVSEATPEQWYPSVSSAQVCELATRGDGGWQPGVADGAWWQMVTSAFTHVEIWHIATNMVALVIFAPMAEQLLGRTRFLAVYLAGALGGSLVVLWFSSPTGSTVGASGALFGLLGALLVVFAKAKLDSRWLIQNLTLGVIITVVGWKFISWQGHLGGFLAGAAAAAIVAFAPKTNRSVIQWAGLAVLFLVLLALTGVRAIQLA